MKGSRQQLKRLTFVFWFYNFTNAFILSNIISTVKLLKKRSPNCTSYNKISFSESKQNKNQNNYGTQNQNKIRIKIAGQRRELLNIQNQLILKSISANYCNKKYNLPNPFICPCICSAKVRGKGRCKWK